MKNFAHRNISCGEIMLRKSGSNTGNYLNDVVAKQKTSCKKFVFWKE